MRLTAREGVRAEPAGQGGRHGRHDDLYLGHDRQAEGRGPFRGPATESLFEIYGPAELGVDTVLLAADQLRKPGSFGGLHRRAAAHRVGQGPQAPAQDRPGRLRVPVANL